MEREKGEEGKRGNDELVSMTPFPCSPSSLFPSFLSQFPSSLFPVLLFPFFRSR